MVGGGAACVLSVLRRGCLRLRQQAGVRRGETARQGGTAVVVAQRTTQADARRCPLALEVLVSMDTPTAAAARSSGSNWRGGGVGWRRSRAQAGKWRSANSATAGRKAEGGSSRFRGRCQLGAAMAMRVAALQGVDCSKIDALPALRSHPPVQLARSIISSTIWLASRTCSHAGPGHRSTEMHAASRAGMLPPRRCRQPPPGAPRICPNPIQSVPTPFCRLTAPPVQART